MRRSDLALALAFAAALLATAAAAPSLVSARPAYEIPVHYAVTDGSLDSPGGEGWNEAPPVTVPLASAPSSVPDADETSVERVSVAAARTDERLYLRVTWADASRDRSVGSPRTFADAVAVEMPANATNRPPIAMGGPGDMVNVWYWRGTNTSEELLAGGPGTTTRFPESTVRTEADYADGRWRVVFSRPLAAASQNRTAIPTDRDMDVAFAAWNGSNMERSGRKAASEWYYLALGPGPQGPPYEVILWTVAGVAIVVTTLVTVEGVRRTRGE